MWSVVLRAVNFILIGVGVADIATDWFRRPKDEPKPAIMQYIKTGWINWLITAGVVVLILKYTNLLKKRM